MPRALSGSTSIRSIFPERSDAVAEVEAALELRRGAVRAERDLELARLERRLALRLEPDEPLEVAQEGQLELAPLQLAHLEPDAAQRLAQALAHEPHGILDLVRLDPLAPECLREPGEELVQRVVGDRAA